MDFSRFCLGDIPECMKIFFSKTSYICFNESREHYHSVLRADIGMNNGPNLPTENTHTSDECCQRVAKEILDSFTPDELLTIPWSCKFCGIYKAPADPTQFDNRAVTKGNKVNYLNVTAKLIVC